MRSIIAASVVLLPLPVVPVTRVSPRCDRAMSLITGGNCSSSMVRIFGLMTRRTIAGAKVAIHIHPEPRQPGHVI